MPTHVVLSFSIEMRGEGVDLDWAERIAAQLCNGRGNLYKRVHHPKAITDSERVGLNYHYKHIDPKKLAARNLEYQLFAGVDYMRWQFAQEWHYDPNLKILRLKKGNRFFGYRSRMGLGRLQTPPVVTYKHKIQFDGHVDRTTKMNWYSRALLVKYAEEGYTFFILYAGRFDPVDSTLVQYSSPYEPTSLLMSWKPIAQINFSQIWMCMRGIYDLYNDLIAQGNEAPTLLEPRFEAEAVDLHW